MMLRDADIGPYEGLIYSTAARYAPYLDLELEDVQQILRLKVAQAVTAFNPKRVRVSRERRKEELDGFVFMCVTNRVKDLLKQQKRLNKSRNMGSQLYIAELAEMNPDGFEGQHLRITADEVYAEVEEDNLELPSTLDTFERAVVVLLLLHMNQTEIAAILQVRRVRVREAHRAVMEKMADWRPTPGPAPSARLAA